MSSLKLFWIAKIGLFGLVLFFLLPLTKNKRNRILFISVASIIISTTCLLYCFWGNKEGLTQYYAASQREHRQKQANMRPLLVQFRKAEQRYLLRVENNPKDREAWLNLAQIYLIQQDEARATFAFKKAKGDAE